MMITYGSDLPQFLVRPEPGVYLSDKYVTIDFETTTHGKGLAVYPQNRIVGCCWRVGAGLRELGAQYGWEPNKSYYRRGSEFDFSDVVSLCQRASFLVGHNIKFDLSWLARCGLALENVLVYDTLLGEYVLGGNKWRWSHLSLDAISRRRFGTGKVDIIKTMWDSGYATEDIPEAWLSRYCVQDVVLTESLFLSQRADLDRLGLLPVLYNRCLLTPVLADIESNGMQLDAELVRNKSKELEARYATLERKLNEVTGGINLASPIQTAKFLYETLGFKERVKKQGREWVTDRTGAGRPKTDADTIALLKASDARQSSFLETYKEYKEVYYELTKYLRKMQDCCDTAGGRLLASLNQSNTQTHRLSSTGLDFSMQFQNFPRPYKPLFKARHEGWLVGECDGAQLEFRDAVHLGHDKVGLFDILHGTDIHSVTASVIWPGVDWNGKGKHPKRQDAKPHTFKPLYGGKSGTPDEVRYYEFFRNKYKGVTAWQQKNIDFVLNHKFLETEWGLRFYWPDTRMEHGGYVRNSTAICNYPVQSQATAEIIPIAVVWFWHRLKRSGLRMFMVNTVHDSIVVELPPEEVEAFHELSRQCLIDDVYRSLGDLYGIKFTVPLGCGVSVGETWGSKDETVYEAREDLWIEAAKEAAML